MIRPRRGDFCYDSDELQIMASDIELLKEAGADGFVFGCLTADGSVDKKANSFLLSTADVWFVRFPFICNFRSIRREIITVAMHLPPSIRHDPGVSAVTGERHWIGL